MMCRGVNSWSETAGRNRSCRSRKVGMIFNELESITHPDVNDVVIYFTGRSDPTSRSADVERTSDRERLQAIAVETRSRGLEMPGVRAPTVCFAEGTSDHGKGEPLR
jgi:hypothetical protein